MKRTSSLGVAILVSMALVGCGSTGGQYVQGSVPQGAVSNVKLQQMQRDDGTKSCAIFTDGKLQGNVEGECGALKAMFETQLQNANQPVAVAQTENGWSFSRVANDAVGGVFGLVVGAVLGKAICGNNSDCRKAFAIGGTVIGAGVADEQWRRPAVRATAYTGGQPYYYGSPSYYGGQHPYDRAALEMEAQAASYRTQAANQRFNHRFQFCGYSC